MFKRNAMGNTRAKLLAGAVLMTLGLTAAGAAMSTNVGGGGATLPAGGYVGWNFTTSGAVSPVFSSNVSGKPGSSVDSTSLMGNWASTSSPANSVSYCQTGSGGGKKIFDHSDGTATWGGAGQACTGSASATTGFGADTSVVDPHFVGSDAPMSQNEFNWFGNGTNLGNKATQYGQPSQFPAIVGSVAIAFNNPDVASLDLADAGLCRIFSGQVSNWNQLTASDFNTAPSLPLPSRTLVLAYRGDGSGTTFSLANHLSTVCTSLPSGKFFQADQSFATVTAQFTLPAGSVAGQGNPGVVSAISSTPGAIGYAESANFKHTTVSSTTHVAKVNGKDPYADLPDALTFTTVAVDKVINGWNAAGGSVIPGTPKVDALTGASTAGCMVMADPSTYAKGVGTSYPILAVSNLIFNQKGNGSDLAAVRDLMTYTYNATRRAGATLVGNRTATGGGTGYAFVTAPAAAAKINTCITI
ncbi:substrate-binding domain-containing protein [Luteibacter sp. SG786]|uniref:substrate-binding domain-containing protein n=1 Tax=Luteibacter sp. SG786 TaxID=2587130 RepID=UPI00141DFC49|nr:substrate-binding domain-containing protein [Luteibacter sp. SG786]NII54852.1 ABC-type phosphate transport system substrate-binding protein [Luteibacter sp. SG786]